MTSPGPVLRIHNEFELQDVVDRLDRDAALVERDFALVTIAARLVSSYGEQLCFKGGFVLRHVHGHERFSKDIDATRTNPPENKLDSVAMAETIRQSGMRNLLTLDPGEPVTDSGRSLDFGQIRYSGPLGKGFVSVEVSYREAVIEPPELVAIGEPYYEPFKVPVMQLDEIVAEKLRALVQRVRPTDLSDLAMILRDNTTNSRRIHKLTARKFELVRDGHRRGRIEANIQAMKTGYDNAVGAVAPDAPDYQTASSLVIGRLSALLP
jgi:predicted nucleotidyltransferase component of viral defense system